MESELKFKEVRGSNCQKKKKIERGYSDKDHRAKKRKVPSPPIFKKRQLNASDTFQPRDLFGPNFYIFFTRKIFIKFKPIFWGHQIISNINDVEILVKNKEMAAMLA